MHNMLDDIQTYQAHVHVFSSTYLAFNYAYLCVERNIQSNVINGMPKFVGGIISSMCNWSGN